MKNFLMCLVLLLTTVAASIGQDKSVNFSESGNDFLRLCDNPATDTTVPGACKGFVMGVLDGIPVGIRVEHNAVSASKSVQPFCMDSPEITVAQEVSVLIQYIKTHPQKAHMRTSVLILAAMMDGFPCSTGDK